MRSKSKGHRPLVIWFTGLSGSGKSTIANQVEKELHLRSLHTYSLDGDNIRAGLNSDLGFSQEDRRENVRRIAEVAKLFYDAGIICLAAFITPLKKDREMVKKIIGKDNLLEVYVNTSLEECEKRDVKGHYKKARAGEIVNFTGISAPFHPPMDADIEIKTESETINEAVEKIIQLVQTKIELQPHE